MGRVTVGGAGPPGCWTAVVHGYDESTYGERFADVYDDWYPESEATAAAAERILELANGRPILELGIGTGRLALPMIARGATVTGLDSSAAMLERLAKKPGGVEIEAVLGDMSAPLPPGPYGVVFVANNTLFNVVEPDRQAAIFTNVAAVLEPGGCFVVEAFVPSVPPGSTSGVEVRHLTADRVVLSVHRTDGDRQLAEGSYVELSETGGVRLRPWSIRFCPPTELDELATRAGLALVERYAGWDRAPFDDAAAHHVSIYRRTM